MRDKLSKGILEIEVFSDAQKACIKGGSSEQTPTMPPPPPPPPPPQMPTFDTGPYLKLTFTIYF